MFFSLRLQCISMSVRLRKQAPKPPCHPNPQPLRVGNHSKAINIDKIAVKTCTLSRLNLSNNARTDL